MKNILTECELISQFTNDVHTDFTDDVGHSYGLSSTGDSLVRKDILGNQTRQNNLVMYATLDSINDYERLENSTFLIDLGLYLESQKGNLIQQDINGITYNGKLFSISCNNGMAFEVAEDGQRIHYQLQLQAVYKLYS